MEMSNAVFFVRDQREQVEVSLDNQEKLLNLWEDSYSLCNIQNAQFNASRFKNVNETKEWNPEKIKLSPGLDKLNLTVYDDPDLEKLVEESFLMECSHKLVMKKYTCVEDDHEDSQVVDAVDDSNEEFSVLAADAGKGIAELLVDKTDDFKRELMIILIRLMILRRLMIFKGLTCLRRLMTLRGLMVLGILRKLMILRMIVTLRRVVVSN